MPRRNPAKSLLSVRLDADLAREVRAFCRDQAGTPLFCTLSGFVADAISHHLDVMRTKLRDPKHLTGGPGTSTNNRR